MMPSRSPSALPQESGGSVFRRAAAPILVGLVGIVLADVAIRHTELTTGRYISDGVPPVLAFAMLMIMVLTRPLLRRISPRLALDQGQMFLVYAMMCLGVTLGGSYMIRAFLPHLVSLQYWEGLDPTLTGMARWLPRWYAPNDPEVVRLYFEGTYTDQVPWLAWLPVLLRWSGFLFALFMAALCLMFLVQRRWIHHERLSFPLLYLPLALTAPQQDASVGGLLRRPIFWIGAGLSALHHGLNIGHALIPALPAPGFYVSLDGTFASAPWTPLNSVTLFFMLEQLGFGYFIPLEVTFSTWFFYLVGRALAVFGVARGYEVAGFPFERDQAAGAYLAVAVFLLWNGRRHLRAILHWRGTREERWALVGLVVSSAFVLVWFQRSGLALSLAVPFFAILGACVLVYARIRAETGMPAQFIYPYSLPKELVVNAYSVSGVLEAGGVRGMVVFSSYAWLSRHHYTQAMAAYQLDGIKLSETGRIPHRVLFVALTLALLVGLSGAFWAHLSSYYEIGSLSPALGTPKGEFRAGVALQEYQATANQIALQPLRDTARVGFTLGGFIFAALLAFLRTRFPGNPFHPLGYVLATSYNFFVFAAFVAWLSKLLILRIGGLKLYRRGIPFFIGLLVGHFLVGGILWPLLSIVLGPETSQAYLMYFG